ncbi:MAG: class II aldolase/adducin family protein [Sphingomonadales bacterium]|nr:class II aldolase/adducin family protein [Sphingomonadales bacterium]MBU3993937.1 class II aldolase/adducin family protein [Alphaproteobacteria bacterium]
MNAAEAQTRVDLAACYRLMARYGMTDLIYNHITACIPGTAHQELLINPFGFLYEEITASSLLKINLAGDVLDPGPTSLGLNRAGYVIHSAVHAARDDAVCVIHTHTEAGVAVSCMPQGLMPITQNALRFTGRIGYHEFEGPAIDEDERVRLVAALGTHNALVLRNHGLLTVGRSIGEAFWLMQRLETACKIQVAALAAGPPHWPSEQAQQRTSAVFDPRTGSEHVALNGALEWQALLRQLDRTDQSYRD